ncbi:MAG TPA: EthD family reductase [Chloroflexia bacterium]|nr:EthD family reductase [Chloroflexia bacterium]
MIQLVALFKRPQDSGEFDAHYAGVHSPLMRKVPGLERMEVTRNLQAFRGEPEYYLVAEMYFRDRESFDAAMSSEENRAAGKDLMSFAREYVTMFYGEVEG